MLVRGVFVFSELAPKHLPLAFAVTPPGGLYYVLQTPAMGLGVFVFYFKYDFVSRVSSGEPTGGASYLSLAVSRA